MSENVPTEKNKIPIVGSFTNLMWGALVSAISVMYLDSRAANEFVKQQLKDEKADHSITKTQLKDCWGGRIERAEKAVDFHRANDVQK